MIVILFSSKKFFQRFEVVPNDLILDQKENSAHILNDQKGQNNERRIYSKCNGLNLIRDKKDNLNCRRYSIIQ